MRNKKERKKIKPSIIIVTATSIIIVVILIIFNNKVAKKEKVGNNSTSQEIVDYILNINSYEAKIEITVESNKNTNKYTIKQNYNKQEETQEILEPSNIAGVRLTKSGNTLKLENTNLNLVTIFENYQYIADNNLDLSSFINDYKENRNATWEEKNGIIEMKTQSLTNSKIQKILYINRENGTVEKMEIKDNNKKTVIYIIYSEVIVNS